MLLTYLAGRSNSLSLTWVLFTVVVWLETKDGLQKTEWLASMRNRGRKKRRGREQRYFQGAVFEVFLEEEVNWEIRVYAVFLACIGK